MTCMTSYWKLRYTYPGTAENFWVSPIISGTGKATYFKFGQYFQRVHLNKIKPMKYFGKKGAWAYPRTAQFFRVPRIISERGKLRISNLAHTFMGSIGTKAH